MNEDTQPDPIIYSEFTPFYKVALPDTVMPEKLRAILWNHYIEQLGVLYIAMSNFPEPFQGICDILCIDFDDLKQEITDRLSAKFLQEANSSREDYASILNPQMQKLSRYVGYCDLLNVPGVIAVREYEHFQRGKSLAVYVSTIDSDVTTSFLIPDTHPATGLHVTLIREH